VRDRTNVVHVSKTNYKEDNMIRTAAATTRTTRTYECGCVHHFEGALGVMVDSAPCDAHSATRKVAPVAPVAAVADDSWIALLLAS
jgi:hypothetical protein